MGNPAPLAFISRGAHTVAHTFSRWFPRPHVLLPPAAGIDISDASIKWIVLDEGSGGREVRSWGHESLPEGIVVNGVIKDVPALSNVLATVKVKAGVECAHAALPEEAAYVFSMMVPEGSSRQQVLSMIEFELEDRVPIQPAVAVYDFDKIM